MGLFFQALLQEPPDFVFRADEFRTVPDGIEDRVLQPREQLLRNSIRRANFRIPVDGGKGSMI